MSSRCLNIHIINEYFGDLDQRPHHFLPWLILSISHSSDASTVILEAFLIVEQKLSFCLCVINGSSLLKLIFNVLLSGWCSYVKCQQQYSLWCTALHITLSHFCGLLTILVKLQNANKCVPTPVTHPMTYSCNFDSWAENILMLSTYLREFAPCQYCWILKAFPVGVDWFPEGGWLLLSCPLLNPMVERRVERKQWSVTDSWGLQSQYSPISNESVRECHGVMFKLITMGAIYFTNTLLVQKSSVRCPST